MKDDNDVISSTSGKHLNKSNNISRLGGLTNRNILDVLTATLHYVIMIELRLDK